MVKLFKLISGEEIIARVNGESDWCYDLEKPFMVHMVQQRDGVGVGLVPWIAGNLDVVVQLKPSALAACPMEPHAQLEKQYLEQTSGIQIATANGNNKIQM